MTIYIVRHTKPKIEMGICYGQTDLDVGDSFDQEITSLQKYVFNYSDYKCISSPLQRCTKLALALGFSEYQTEPLIQEIDFGEWELQPWDNISRDKLDKWADNLQTFRFPKGESFLDLKVRVSSFIDSLDFEKDNILIVSHAGVIRVFFHILCEMELAKVLSIKISYGDIFEVQKNQIHKISL